MSKVINFIISYNGDNNIRQNILDVLDTYPKFQFQLSVNASVADLFISANDTRKDIKERIDALCCQNLQAM